MSHPSKKTRTKGRGPSPVDGAKPDGGFEALVPLFLPRVIQRTARESGFIPRDRNTPSRRSLNFAHSRRAPGRLQQANPDPILGAGGFYERSTPQLIEFLRGCVAYGLAWLRAYNTPGATLDDLLNDLMADTPPESFRREMERRRAELRPNAPADVMLRWLCE